MKELLNNGSFCPLPWNHLYKHTDGSVRLCCVDKGPSLGSLNTQTVEEIRNSQEFTNIRKSLLSGEKINRCSTCWENEKNGYKSYREGFNAELQNNYPEGTLFEANKPHAITYLDHRPSNLCNLGCKSCDPEYSTKLIQPYKEMNLITNQEVNRLTKLTKSRPPVNYLDDYLADLNFVYFAGGEPLISEDHWNILDKLIEIGNTDIRLRYNTNLTVLEYKGKNILDYWEKFSYVEIGASLDGFEKEFEYLRSGANWKVIVENLDRIKYTINNQKEKFTAIRNTKPKGEGISLTCDSTIGWMNLKSVLKLHRFLLKNGYLNTDDKEYFPLLTKPLFTPEGASLNNTHPLLREELINSVKAHKKWLRGKNLYHSNLWEQNLNALINMVENSSFSMFKFKEWIKKNQHLDKRYNLNLLTAFKFKNSEFNQLLKNIYELYNR